MNASHDASREDGPRHVLPLREPRRPQSLEQILATITAEVTADRRQRRVPDVTISLEIMASLAAPLDPEAIRTGLAPLVAAACEAAGGPAPASDGPRLREVVVTAVNTPRGLEIEVADTGPGPDRLPAATLDSARRWAKGHTASLEVTACPEGGAAVTLCLPSRRVHDLSIRPAA